LSSSLASCPRRSSPLPGLRRVKDPRRLRRGSFRDKNLCKQRQLSVPSFLKAMVLDIPADDLRCDFVPYRTRTIAIFPAFPAPEATLHAWTLTQESPGTQALAPRDDLRQRVSGRAGAKARDRVWTHLHVLSRDVVLLCNSRQKLLTRCCISPCKTSRRSWGDQTK
jgi:hypothetical protein